MDNKWEKSTHDEWNGKIETARENFNLRSSPVIIVDFPIPSTVRFPAGFWPIDYHPVPYRSTSTPLIFVYFLNSAKKE